MACDAQRMAPRSGFRCHGGMGLPVVWRLRGVVVHGEKRGRELGYPTANVAVEVGDLPPDGVHAATVLLEGARPCPPPFP